MHRVGELHIVEEAACWERKFMLFKAYLRQSVGTSSRPKPSKSVRQVVQVVHHIHTSLCHQEVYSVLAKGQ